jgi:hypothetical protein
MKNEDQFEKIKKEDPHRPTLYLFFTFEFLKIATVCVVLFIFFRLITPAIDFIIEAWKYLFG